MTWALVFIVCYRPGVCAPILAADGLPSLTACQIAGAMTAGQAPGRVAKIVCIDSRRVGVLLGRHQA